MTDHGLIYRAARFMETAKSGIESFCVSARN